MKTTLQVEGMHCEHCAASVTSALSSLPGVGKVAVDLSAKKVDIEHEDTVSLALMKDAVEEQGYDVVG